MEFAIDETAYRWRPSGESAICETPLRPSAWPQPPTEDETHPIAPAACVSCPVLALRWNAAIVVPPPT